MLLSFLTSFASFTVCLQGCAGGRRASLPLPAAPGLEPVAARIPLSGYPWDISISPDGKAAYVSRAPGELTVIDTSTNAVQDTIRIPHLSSRISLSPDGRSAYASTEEGMIAALDTAARTMTSRLPIGGNPGVLAVDSSGGVLYVTDRSRWSVSVLNLATGQVGPTIYLPGSQWPPLDIAVAPSARWLYVLGCSGFCTAGTLWVVDATTNSCVATVRVGAYPTRLAVTPDGRFIYVTNKGDATVSVIDASNNTVIATIAVEVNPTGVTANRQGTRVYVTNLTAGTLSIIQTATNAVVATLRVGGAPNAVALTPDAAFAYVANLDEIAVVDLGRVTIAGSK